ncbi:MAG: hypothetical protein ACREIJ_07595 [Nitrospiraceae bacterium]
MHFLEFLIEMVVHALDALFPQKDKTKQHHFVGVFLIFLTVILSVPWIFLN